MFGVVVFIIAKQNETQTERHLDVQEHFPKHRLKEAVGRALLLCLRGTIVIALNHAF